MTQTVSLFVGGEFCQSQSSQWIDVTNPATNEVIAKARSKNDKQARIYLSLNCQ